MSTTPDHSQPLQKGWLLWVAFFAIIASLIVGGSKRSVLVYYHEASNRWVHSQELYSPSGEGFLYFPVFALVYVPFWYLPPLAAALLWRAGSLLLLALGFWKWSKLTGNTDESSFLLASLVTLPICWGAILNGQATTAMTGVLMCAYADAHDRRWWRTTLWFLLALIAKPIAAAPVCLLAALHRPLWWRAPLAILGAFAIPFAAHSPTYVWEQTVGWFELVRAANEAGMSPNWAHLLGALELFGVHFAPQTQLVIRVGAGLVVLGMCALLMRYRPRVEAHFFTLTLGMAYLMLFNPRTEGNTYLALAPCLGLLIAGMVRRADARVRTALWIGCAVAIFGNYELSKLFLPNRPHIWLAPFAALVLVVTMLPFLYREKAQFQAPALAGTVAH